LQIRTFAPITDGANFASQGNQGVNDPDGTGIALATNGKKYKSYITCFKCHKKGHYASKCPTIAKSADDKTEVTGHQHVTTGSHLDDPDSDKEEIDFVFMTTGTIKQEDGVLLTSEHWKVYASIPSTWVLLDNCSTMDIFYNPNLVKNIRKGNCPMNIHCTAGMTSTNLIADLPGYGTIWFHLDGIANILSLSRVKRKYQVTYDSKNGNAFLVHTPDGTTRHFEESEGGLYYSNTELQAGGNVLVTTVADKKAMYTHQVYSRTVMAWKIRQITGRPSTQDFIQYMDNSLLGESPINRYDILAAEDIFGPDVGSLKGKTMRRTPHRVNAIITAMPIDIMTQYHQVTMSADVMFVNQIPMFLTVSHAI